MKPILSFTMFEHLIPAVSTQLECCPALYADTSQACISPLNRKTQVGAHFPQASLPVQCWSLNLSSINPSGVMQPTYGTLLKQAVIKYSFAFFLKNLLWLLIFKSFFFFLFFPQVSFLCFYYKCVLPLLYSQVPLYGNLMCIIVRLDLRLNNFY